MKPCASFLESSLERIARIIAQKRGVNVRLQGGMAYVDLDTREIVLPRVTDKEHKVLAPCLDGLLDHEVAHVLYTDPECGRVAHENVARHGIWNVLEDFWIDRRISQAYAGCAENIKRSTDFLVGMWKSGRYESSDRLGKLSFALGECLRGKKVSDFEDDSEIGALVDLLLPEIEDGKTLSSSREALDLADRILEKIRNAGQKKSEAGSEKSEGPAYKNDFPEKNTEETGDSFSEQVSSQAEAFEAGKADFEEPMDLESAVNGQIVPPKYSEGEPSEYRVFSTEFDADTTYSVDERIKYTAEYGKICDQISRYVGTMASNLEQALLAETEARWVAGERRGRRYARRELAQWVAGSDSDRFYKRLESGEKIDTAVSLLWDCSGSMGSNGHAKGKSALARIAAAAFHESLKRSNIPHDVLGFNTGSTCDAMTKLVQAAKARGDNLWAYSRLDELDNRMVFVDYGQVDGRAIARIDGRHSNRDGECVLWAAGRLARRPEARKILIVGSDGQPAGARYSGLERKYLREVVSRILDSGIEVVGIGIQTDAVQDYYPQSVVINNAEDLPRVVVGELSRLLLGKGTCNGQRKAVGIG